MLEVSVTVFRSHIPDYLAKVRGGETIALTLRGKVVAHLKPPVDESLQARQRLGELAKRCRVGDVESPLTEGWEAESADS